MTEISNVAEQDGAQIEEIAEKVSGEVEQATKAVENPLSIGVRAMRGYNRKLLEIAQANADAAFDFAQQLTRAKSVSEMMELWTGYVIRVKSASELMELWTSHAHRQFEARTEQTPQLATPGQSMAIDSAEPVTKSVTRTVNKAA